MTISQKLVDLIERNAADLTGKWLELVKKHPGTRSYHTYDQAELYERAFSVYSQLGKWLSDSTTQEGIERIYTTMGAQRRKEGFKLSEVMQALIITRRVLWGKIEADGLLDSALDLNMALHLNNRTILFFDRAMIYAAQGYESGA
jgi:hypothetical protein